MLSPKPIIRVMITAKYLIIQKRNCSSNLAILIHLVWIPIMLSLDSFASSRTINININIDINPEQQVAPVGEPLAMAESNFTSYIAERDTNFTWPISSAANHKGKDTQFESRNKNSSKPLELTTFFNENLPDDNNELDDEDGEQEEEEEEEEGEEALASLLGRTKGLNDNDFEQLIDEDDFYNINPVDTIQWKLNNHTEQPKHAPLTPANKQLIANKLPDQDRKIIYSNFSDFDDIEALRLKTFYQPNETSEYDVPRNGQPRQVSQTERKFTQNLSPKYQTQASKRVEKGKHGSVLVEPKKYNKRRKRRRRRRGRRMKKKKKNKAQQVDAHRISAPTSSRVTAESRGGKSGVVAARAGQCAFVIQTGACVTYDSVEWALRQARRLIGFARPPGLGSLEPSESTIHAVGELTEWTSRLLAMRFGLSGDELTLGLEQVDMSQTSLWSTCPRLFRSPVARQCYTRLQASGNAAFYNSQRAILLSGRYRTHTGQCNNPHVPNYGSSFMPFVRLNEPEYGDGLGSIRGARGPGGPLPPARLVSLNLHPSYDVPSTDHSALFAAWGQLINHDLALASGARVATGHDGSCCSRLARSNENINNQRLISDSINRVCMPILVGPDDPVYGPHGVRCHDFKRSIAGLRPGCSLGPRTQLNLVTSYVDGSFVYGSTRSMGATLRSATRRGQLAMWQYFGANRQPLLPPRRERPDDECPGRREGFYCFQSGDLRTNQQVPLVALHTIHARQHNRLARALGALNPHWPSDRIYAEARHIHIAQIQHILISEYLPQLLGAKVMAKFNLIELDAKNSVNQAPYWDHYEPSLNPGISQEFAAAAFRQGHSSVPGEVFRLDPLTRAPRRVYQLRALFHQPWPLFEPGAMDEFLAGLVDAPAQGQDPFVSLELTGHLLEEPDEPVGLDLIAINIQRGRDQGVASYNSMRDWCGLGRLANFHELARALGARSAQLMANLYESVDDIDLYSGGLSEMPLEGAQLGPTFACIVGHQFGQLRRADRYWFESSQGPHAFTSGQLESIKQVPLARLVCANSDQLHLMQPLAMRMPHPIYNPIVACNELPDLDMGLWFEPAPVALQEDVNPDEDEDDDD